MIPCASQGTRSPAPGQRGGRDEIGASGDGLSTPKRDSPRRGYPLTSRLGTSWTRSLAADRSANHEARREAYVQARVNLLS